MDDRTIEHPADRPRGTGHRGITDPRIMESPIPRRSSCRLSYPFKFANTEREIGTFGLGSLSPAHASRPAGLPAATAMCRECGEEVIVAGSISEVESPTSSSPALPQRGERHGHPRRGQRTFLQQTAKAANRSFGALQIPRPLERRGQIHQVSGRDRVARGQGRIDGRLAAGDQLLVVVGREEEAPLLVVPKQLQLRLSSRRPLAASGGRLSPGAAPAGHRSETRSRRGRRSACFAACRCAAGVHRTCAVWRA